MSLRRTALIAALALTACTDAGPRPGPGTITATLRSPNGDEGAAVLLLAGEGVTRVEPVGDTEVHASTSGDETRVVLINQLGGTLAFEVSVANLRGSLVADLIQVAGPDDALRTDLSGYRVELAR